MSVEGIGPSTSVLSGQRSTTELHTRLEKLYQIYERKAKFPSRGVARFRDGVDITRPPPPKGYSSRGE